MPIAIIEARRVDQHEMDILVRDRVWSDTPGVGFEVTRFLLCVPGELVDELIILNLRIRCQGYYELLT